MSTNEVESAINDLYNQDQIRLKNLHSSPLSTAYDDILDSENGVNLRGNFEDNVNKTKLFIKIRKSLPANGSGILCETMQLRFNIPLDFGWIRRGQSLYPRSIITHQNEQVYQPFSLMHMAAAASTPALMMYTPNSLFNVLNNIKNKSIYVRVGEETKRKHFDFRNILKHILYMKMGKPLFVSHEYFENLYENPKPFCTKCGIIQKIEKSLCECEFCNFSRVAIAFTPSIEIIYHTNECEQIY